MTLFLIIAAAMVVAACAIVLVPLLRRRSGGGVEHEAANLAVLRDQRAELERDLAQGTITADHYEAARLELDRRVLEETRAAEARPAAPPRSVAWTAGLVGAVLPLAAAGLYYLLGTPAALSPEFAKAQAPDTPEHAVSAQEIEGMIEKVKARLANDPGNVDGWVVLARTYYVTNRPREAAAAFEKATALAPNDAGLLADYADALGVAQGRSLDGKPAELVERALKADPDHWKALALAGTIAFGRKQYPQAVEYWERMKRNVPPESPMAQSIDGSIAEARQLGGLPAAAPTASAPPVAPAPRAAASAPVAPAAAAGPGSAASAGRSGRVAGTVTIAPALAVGVSPDDAVFVFARPADGSRMPLALLRKQVRDLPLAFTLDDSLAMAPNFKLSDHSEVIVGARISKSGSPMPQSGDLEGLSAPVRSGATGVTLVVDRRLP